MTGRPSRRVVLALGLSAAAARSWAAPVRRSVAFQVWRGGTQIGEHAVTVTAAGDRLVAAIAAHMRVKLGPVPVFNYRHEATETWDGERFVSLASRSVSNGKVETVDARRADASVTIARSAGRPLAAPAACLPLTHWNRDALHGPLFNPQTGAVVRCTVTRRGVETVRYADGRSGFASGFTIAGDADIVDWYDDAGAWAALRARAPDGSTLEYRRV